MADQSELAPVPVATGGYIARTTTDDTGFCPDDLSVALDGYVTRVAIIVPPVPVADEGMSWLAMLATVRQTTADEARRARTACPNDGTPLETGPDGELHCPFDGWRPHGVPSAWPTGQRRRAR